MAKQYDQIHVYLSDGAEGQRERRIIEQAAARKRGRKLSNFMVEAALAYAAAEAELDTSTALRAMLGAKSSQVRERTCKLCNGPIAKNNASGVCRVCQRSGRK